MEVRVDLRKLARLKVVIYYFGAAKSVTLVSATQTLEFFLFVMQLAGP